MMRMTKSLIPLLTAACLLPLSLQAATAEDDTGPSSRDYLADSSRVGSLAGTLLGGALTAHPAGTVLGAVVGYVVGKKSDFTSDEETETADAGQTEAGRQQARMAANPLRECFGERSRQARNAAIETAPVVGSSDEGGLTSLVSFEPVSGSEATSSRVSMPSYQVGNVRSRRSPCFYYSSW